ncbi:hypothetical protein U9M48_032369 [Paspalum notatum var. saurae]|uniref:Uncharacterized protein n=1 Tax=Paspalum notatum var. saurae TaxID=547442 RepID=A0AAQ3U4Z3_PASNO
MGTSMGICVITVDLECCRCKAKIAKVLDCLKADFPIEKVEFEEKNNKVVVRGKYDAEKLSQAVWCKAGKIVVKEIVIVDVWPVPPPPKPKPKCDVDCHHCKHTCCKVVCSCCSCEHCKPKPEKKEEKPKPKVEYKLVPYPYMWQYPCPSWPNQCPPHQQCQSCSQQKPPEPAPPPPPPQPQPCACSTHGCGGAPPGWPPHMPPVWPPPWAGTCNVDENQCSVM